MDKTSSKIVCTIHKTDVQSIDYSVFYILCRMIKLKDTKGVLQLLAKNNVNAKTIHAALIVAVTSKNVDIINILIRQDISKQLQSDILHIACEAEDITLVCTVLNVAGNDLSHTEKIEMIMAASPKWNYMFYTAFLDDQVFNGCL